MVASLAAPSLEEIGRLDAIPAAAPGWAAAFVRNLAGRAMGGVGVRPDHVAVAHRRGSVGPFDIYTINRGREWGLNLEALLSFTEAVWAEAWPVLRAIDAHPFVRELGEGRLSPERFQAYMVQDALYLRGFARALAFGAVKAPDAERILEFSKAAEVAIVVERALHAGFLQQFGVDAVAAETAEASPTCTAYVNHLLAAAAVGAFGDLAAAVLPCFWIYQDVGARIAGLSAPGNPYQAWVDTYAGEEFEAATARMRAIVDREADAAGPALRESMRRGFTLSCRYEWMFWDAAWRLEAWPVDASAPPA